MASLIENLKDTLSEQLESYEILLEISTKKKVAIVENEIVKIQEFISRENTLVGKLQRLERKRKELFDDISTVLFKPKGITLVNIIKSLEDTNDASDLQTIRDKTLDVIEKLNTINIQNQELINIASDYIEFSVNILRQANQKMPTFYDSAGNEIEVDDKKMFDAKQ